MEKIKNIIGTKILLTHKSKKGKQKLREFGNVWTVLRAETIQAFNNELGMLIHPARDNDSHDRWIRVENDIDFNWTVT